MKVYRYGLLGPRDAAPVMEQMQLAHRHRNTLIEIERGRRAAIRAAERNDPAAAGCAAVPALLRAGRASPRHGAHTAARTAAVRA